VTVRGKTGGCFCAGGWPGVAAAAARGAFLESPFHELSIGEIPASLRPTSEKLCTENEETEFSQFSPKV
jgi:hypothetical protein